METEKRLALCFALSMLIIVAFSWYNAKMHPPLPPDQTTDEITDTNTPGGAQTPLPSQEDQPESEKSVAAPVVTQSEWNWIPGTPPETDPGAVVIESDLYQVTISKAGAIPTSWLLLHYDELYEDPRKLNLQVSNGTPAEQEKAQLELDRLQSVPEDGTRPMESVNPTYEKGEAGLILRWGSNRSDRYIPYQCGVDRITVQQSTPIRFVYTNAGVTMEKIYTFHPDRYDVDLEVKISNQSGQPLSFSKDGFYDINWMGGFGFASERYDAQNNALLQLDGSTSILTTDMVKKEFSSSETRPLQSYEEPTLMTTGKTVNWIGVGQKYFLAAIVPKTQTNDSLKGVSSPGNGLSDLLRPHTGIRMPMRAEIINNANQSDKFTIYVGPMQEDQLVQASPSLVEARKIFLRRFTGPIAGLMLSLLQGFHYIVPNYGVSIILLTLLLKIIMLPLYTKQVQSMRKMQALQPQINALKEQYKDDAQKLQKEQMELFRKNKVNPLAGCLTMLPTIPLFIALYATFSMAVELRGSEFFGWIQDLSTPDSAFYIPIGSYIFTVNILPLTYAALMLWSSSQQKVEGPNAAMMKYMPLMFVFFFWSFASGVILYFVISMFIDVIQRLLMEKFNPSEPPLASAKKT